MNKNIEYLIRFDSTEQKRKVKILASALGKSIKDLIIEALKEIHPEINNIKKI